jgi:hypothetical protein
MIADQKAASTPATAAIVSATPSAAPQPAVVVSSQPQASGPSQSNAQQGPSDAELLAMVQAGTPMTLLQPSDLRLDDPKYVQLTYGLTFTRLPSATPSPPDCPHPAPLAPCPFFIYWLAQTRAFYFSAGKSIPATEDQKFLYIITLWLVCSISAIHLIGLVWFVSLSDVVRINAEGKLLLIRARSPAPSWKSLGTSSFQSARVYPFSITALISN